MASPKPLASRSPPAHCPSTRPGSVNLLNNNAIAKLGSVTVIGAGNGFALSDGSALTVTGTVAVPAQVFLQDTAAAGVTIAAGSKVSAGTLATFQTDAFSSSGSVVATTFEVAPFLLAMR